MAASMPPLCPSQGWVYFDPHSLHTFTLPSKQIWNLVVNFVRGLPRSESYIHEDHTVVDLVVWPEWPHVQFSKITLTLFQAPDADPETFFLEYHRLSGDGSQHLCHQYHIALLRMLQTHGALPQNYRLPRSAEYWPSPTAPDNADFNRHWTAQECTTIGDMATSDFVDVRLNGIQMLLTVLCERPHVLPPLNWDLVVDRLFHGRDARLLYAAACLVQHQPNVVSRETWQTLIKQLPLLPKSADPFDELLLRHPLQQLHQWMDGVIR